MSADHLPAADVAHERRVEATMTALSNAQMALADLLFWGPLDDDLIASVRDAQDRIDELWSRLYDLQVALLAEGA